MTQKLNEKALIDLLNIAAKWVEEYPDAQHTILYTLNLVSFVAHLFIREQYSFIVNYQSDASLVLRKILMNMKTFTN